VLSGVLGLSLCLFCYAKQESKDHIFFSCSFSSRIWKGIMGDCSFDDVPTSWDIDVEIWSPKLLRGEKFAVMLGETLSCCSSVSPIAVRKRSFA
jgi:hypothetical protein